MSSWASYGETSNCIDPRLLTLHAHESQHLSLSRLDPFISETSANNSQPQLFSKLFSYDVQRPLPSPTLSIRATHEPNDMSEEVYPSPSSLPSSGQFTPQTESLSGVDQACLDASDGEMVLKRSITSSVCEKCKKSFPTRSYYHRHINKRSCQAPSKCKHCGQLFKLEKDLQRHLGSIKASTSCPKLENANCSTSFACVCRKSYTRKDSLMRHLRASSSDDHCCRVRNKSPCLCS